MEEISLQEIFYILRKRIWIIVGLTLTALIVSGVLSFFVITPQYETFTTLLVGRPQDYKTESSIQIDDIMLSEKLVPTYGELAKSKVVADNVIDKLKLDMTYGAFQNKIEVSLLNNTEIIKILARDPDKELAAKISDQVSEEFMVTVKETMKIDNVQIIDRAVVPENPVSPRKLLNMAIGAVLGFMAGVFLTFLLEYLDNTIKTPKDVERVLNLPVLGTIPDIGLKEEDKIAIVKKNPKSPIAEAFRTLRTNIQFTSVDKEIKVLAVTSATPGEGKSILASNLAISLSQEEKKILFIDCDLRKPKGYEMFNIPNTVGLTSLLMGKSSLADTVYSSGELGVLDVITSGPIPPNPSELLSSDSMREFLEGIKEKYDMIILDTPPLGPVTDAAIISTIADGMLLVIETGKAAEGQVEYARESLDKVNANVIGAVLNKMPIRKGRYGGYGYIQAYSYYGDE